MRCKNTRVVRKTAPDEQQPLTARFAFVFYTYGELTRCQNHDLMPYLDTNSLFR